MPTRSESLYRTNSLLFWYRQSPGRVDTQAPSLMSRLSVGFGIGEGMSRLSTRFSGALQRMGITGCAPPSPVRRRAVPVEEEENEPCQLDKEDGDLEDTDAGQLCELQHNVNTGTSALQQCSYPHLVSAGLASAAAQLSAVLCVLKERQGFIKFIPLRCTVYCRLTCTHFYTIGGMVEL